MEQLTKNQAVATSQEAVQNQNEPQLRDENAHNDKSVHGVLNPTYQAGLRRRSEERFSRNAETDLVCRLLLEKKNDLNRESALVIKGAALAPGDARLTQSPTVELRTLLSGAPTC